MPLPLFFRQSAGPPRSDEILLERRKAVETDRRVGRGVRAGAEDFKLVADREAERQLITGTVIEHVHLIAGRPGEHDRTKRTAVLRRADAVLDRKSTRLNSSH